MLSSNVMVACNIELPIAGNHDLEQSQEHL